MQVRTLICEDCGTRVTREFRADARYCSEACRQRAVRNRRTVKQTRAEHARRAERARQAAAEYRRLHGVLFER